MVAIFCEPANHRAIRPKNRRPFGNGRMITASGIRRYHLKCCRYRAGPESQQYPNLWSLIAFFFGLDLRSNFIFPALIR
jgi:hypothetical protein